MKKKGVMLGAAIGLGCWAVAAAVERRSFGQLKGKTVLITGSSRGLGLALAEQFGRNGARLLLTARDAAELQEAKEQLIAQGVAEEDVSCIPCDLTNYDETKAMVALATERMGRIDVLVNNAGVISVGPVEDQPVTAFKDAIESNYYSALHATHSVLPQMLARCSGNIVNIASIGGKIAVPHLLPYSASKFALVGFSQGLHAELIMKGIQVTTVCPGLMRTGGHIQALFTGDREREYRWFSMGASLPAVSIAATSAARKIVRATVRGDAELKITPQASIAAGVAQLAPAFTGRLLGLVNHVILPTPQSTDNSGFERGEFVRGKELTLLTVIGNAARRRLNQHG